MPVTTVGAIARIDAAGAGRVHERLERLAGVETFATADPDRTGVIIEAADLDAAHRILTEDVGGADGVLGVWPVYVHLGDDEDPGTVSAPHPPMHAAEGVCHATDPT